METTDLFYIKSETVKYIKAFSNFDWPAKEAWLDLAS